MNNETSRYKATVIASIVAVLLQIIIAPNIAIGGVVPNFLLVLVVVTAITYGSTRACVLGFILGLVFDLIGAGPVGVMSLVLALLGYMVGAVNKSMFSDGWVIPIITLAIAAFIGETLYGLVLTIIGYETSFFVSLVSRMLPGALYDTIFGLILFPLFSRFSKPKRPFMNRSHTKLR